MTKQAHLNEADGMAALGICESLLIALTELKVISEPICCMQRNVWVLPLPPLHAHAVVRRTDLRETQIVGICVARSGAKWYSGNAYD